MSEEPVKTQKVNAYLLRAWIAREASLIEEADKLREQNLGLTRMFHDASRKNGEKILNSIQLEEIVRNLAAVDARTTNNCDVCGGEVDHFENCPWVAARDWVEAQV